MRPLFPSILTVFICFLLANNLKAQEKAYGLFNTYDEFQTYVTKYSKSTVVINFWATYCGPCVKEIPYFETLQKKYADQNVKVILVNLDFRHQLKERLVPFLEKHSLSTEVVVLADQDADTWIPKVSSSWDGGLPFTTLLKKGAQTNHPQEFQNFEDLEKFVLPFVDPLPKSSLTAKERP